MPFTLAHPIAAAPIWFGSRRRLDLPSLIIGSMVPDLSYFLSLHPIKSVGHTLPGILMEGVPYSIGLLLISRYILMRPCLALIPQQLARHFPVPNSHFSVKLVNIINVVISIVLGAVSHLVWDRFTHRTSSSFTHSQLSEFYFGWLSIYQLFQYSSSLFGLVALGIWLFKWLNRTKYRHQTETLTPSWRGLTIISICLSAFGLAIIAIEAHHVTGETSAEVVVRALIGWISGTFLGLLLYSIAFWVLGRLKPGTMTI
jgi:Domain of unknown function (DUF4184)